MVAPLSTDLALCWGSYEASAGHSWVGQRGSGGRWRMLVDGNSASARACRCFRDVIWLGVTCLLRGSRRARSARIAATSTSRSTTASPWGRRTGAGRKDAPDDATYGSQPAPRDRARRARPQRREPTDVASPATSAAVAPTRNRFDRSRVCLSTTHR
jgi:hypothetical protein